MAVHHAEYDELEVRIERAAEDEDVYNVRVKGPDGGTKRGTFTSPFTELRLENFVLKVGRARIARRGGGLTDEAEAKRVGEQLFKSLFSGDVYGVYRSALDRARDRERGLRVTLYLTDAPALLHYPWEFLYERPRHLARSVHTPIVRSLDLETVRRPRKVTLPIQVLGIDSRPTGRVPLDADAERADLEQALAPLEEAGLVRLRWLDHATLRELQRTLDAPDDVHVIHYIGHGEFDERTETGMLVLEGPDGSPDLVSGEDLGGLLYDESSLRLVVLNACEGARASHRDPFSGVASGLVACDIPAVVGMQFEITDDAAVTFAQQLYQSLAQGWPVDAALTQARRAIWTAGLGTEWGTPVLFLRSGDAHLFDIDAAPAVPVVEDRKPPPPERAAEPPPPAKRASSAGRAAVAVELERVPVVGQPPEAATWELSIANSGERALAEVLASQSDGDVLGEPVTLEPGRRHTLRWTDPQAADACRTIRVSGVDPDGDWVTVDVEAKGNRWLFTKRIDELEGIVYANQKGELLRRLTESETLLGMCRCGRPDDATRGVVLVITTEQLVSVRETLWSSTSGMSHRWSDVTAVTEVAGNPKRLTIHTGDGVACQFTGLLGKGVTLGTEPLDFSFEGVRDRLSDLARASAAATEPARLVRSSNHAKWVKAVAFSGDSARLASGSVDKTARVVAVTGGEQVVQVKHGGLFESIEDVALTRDGRHLATSSGDRTARVWELPSARELLKLSHPNWVRAIDFGPDGRTLATGCDDKLARVWELPSGRARHELQHGGYVHCVAFDASGQRLATGSSDDHARVWDVASGAQLTVLPCDGTVRCVAFTPDGAQLLAGGEDKTARLWALPDGRECLRLELGNKVSGVAVSPDGSRLATACESDNAVRIWGLDGRQTAQLPLDGWAVCVSFSPDGKYLAAGSRDNRVRLWRLTEA
jgi:WD40 repeat protein